MAPALQRSNIVSEPIILGGLAGHHPLGALAAFGLLRCCEELPGLQGSRLAWRKMPGWTAALHPCAQVDGEQLVEALVGRMRERHHARELNWVRNLKKGKETYPDAAREAMKAGNRAYADFLAAYACEVQNKDREQLEPTAFFMTSCRQEFPEEARKLARSLAGGISVGRRKKSPTDRFKEALFGPWRYEDPQHSLGWDPSTERLHALRARRPEREKSQGVSAAVLLAFEALPLFPCFRSDGRLATTGFSAFASGGRWRKTYLTWPVWTQPVPLRTVRSLLSLGELCPEKPPVPELRARGIEAVFRSERYRVKTQGAYYILRPAFPCL
jgi:hypothetical protein